MLKERGQVMKRFIFISLGIVFIAVAIGGSADPEPALAAGAADFYKGRVIEFIVPYSPGGGTDVYARMVGPFIQKYSGGTVVIKNVPGAGGIYGMNFLYGAKPNGLKMAIIDTGAVVLAQLFEQKGVRYDFNKFTWLGRVVGSKRALIVGKDSRLKSFQDLQAAKHIKISSTGKTSGASLTWALLAHGLGWPPEKISHVLGYGGGFLGPLTQL